MSSSKQLARMFLFLGCLCLCVLPRASAAEDPIRAEDARIVDIPIQPTDMLLNFVLEIRHTKLDCTHLVHYLYQRFDLDYDYANSISLYKGVKAFRRVARPQAGDLIVWRGHAGIVVDPEEHTFVSALRTGVKVSSYVSNYWKRKGMPRFLHYVGDGDAD